MTKIPTSQLLKELQAIDERVILAPNANRPGLSNFIINGRDLCPVPSDMLQDEHSNDYVYIFPGDRIAPMKTYAEAKGQCEAILLRLKDEAFSNDFFAPDEA